MNYQIELTEDALKELSRIPRNVRNGILTAIKERLSEAPRRFKPLIGNWKGFFRLRVGDYRVIYKVEDERQLWSFVSRLVGAFIKKSLRN